MHCVIGGDRIAVMGNNVYCITSFPMSNSKRLPSPRGSFVIITCSLQLLRTVTPSMPNDNTLPMTNSKISSPLKAKAAQHNVSDGLAPSGAKLRVPRSSLYVSPSKGGSTSSHIWPSRPNGRTDGETLGIASVYGRRS
jgi:hypothetical protein